MRNAFEKSIKSHENLHFSFQINMFGQICMLKYDTTCSSALFALHGRLLLILPRVRTTFLKCFTNYTQQVDFAVIIYMNFLPSLHMIVDDCNVPHNSTEKK